MPKAENFEDLITADQNVLSEGCESRHSHRYAVGVEDLATLWLQSYPCKTETSQETQKSLMKFLEPTRKPKVIYLLTIPWILATPVKNYPGIIVHQHRSETNGIAERAVRGVKEGTSAVLLQSGLVKESWADSMECFCHLRDIQDLLSDGKTPYEGRFGKPFNGQVILFGEMVEHHSVSTKDLSRLHQFGPKVLPVIILGYVLSVGGLWKRDILVADIEEGFWTRQNSTSEGSMQRKCYRQRKVKILSSQSQMEQSEFLEEIRI